MTLPAIADQIRRRVDDVEAESGVGVGFAAPLSEVHQPARGVRLRHARTRGFEFVAPALLRRTQRQRHRHVRQNRVLQDGHQERRQHPAEGANVDVHTQTDTQDNTQVVSQDIPA